MSEAAKTGYPSIDKPWLKCYSQEAIDAEIPSGTMLDVVKENCRDRLREPALRYFNAKKTYGGLLKEIEHVARSFAAMGVRKGDSVALLLPNTPENTYCLYGLNALGAIADVIDLRSRGEQLNHYIDESDARVAVASTLFIENLLEILPATQLQKVIVVSPVESLPAPVRFLMKLKTKRSTYPASVITWKSFLKRQKPYDASDLTGEDIACVLHTSGTTGLSKGVLLSNRAFNTIAIEYRYGGMKFETGDTLLNQVPPFLAYNIAMATHLPLTLGMEIIMLPDYQPHKFAENMLKLKPNHGVAGPADWGNFLDYKGKPDYDLGFLKMPGSGSDAMQVKDKLAVNELLVSHGAKYPVMEGYGLTEACSAACTNVPQCDVLGSMGIPLCKMTFCIWDNDSGTELACNQEGEICIAGPSLMSGYKNRPSETADALKVHDDGVMWLHTGDLGYLDENGCLFLKGRLKRIIVRHDGIKVVPSNLEKVITENPLVRGCCVVGMADPDHRQGQVPVAFVTTDVSPEGEAAAQLMGELGALCGNALASDYQPYAFQLIDSLPLTPNGKVDYRELERRAAE